VGRGSLLPLKEPHPALSARPRSNPLTFLCGPMADVWWRKIFPSNIFHILYTVVLPVVMGSVCWSWIKKLFTYLLTYLLTIATNHIIIVCCEAVRSAILATAWLLVIWYWRTVLISWWKFKLWLMEDQPHQVTQVTLIYTVSPKNMWLHFLQ